ncbi:Stk1 family PASTA domain-containing Ser/Thr kinase [Slackia equolifaciens]|uniref:non-specific serine/threonine protein kinase n=1 Tax=Slackia equolifaciens TaxID=498718 RepID=A0A3N0AV76_9ACTN|nr:Stk1 family PASTA domain-containing Ser/Thr kinase [Slackia equolifaciens]RNL38773.1 Stk1 family PASTA domain-containing Ser/Thr kinase [Slackia equolifaciens]
MIGRVFNGRYRITERIGIGGMAEVYKAQDQVLGRTVAVKVMLPQYAADPEFTARFKQEAASAANLQSPYIVNVYDWGQDDGTYFIVMEFVRGTDLKSAIQQRGAINQRKVAEIGSQVCQALSVAHGLDIIHRDIKPQNIMVQPDGNVKVMDFGIARAKNSVKTQTSSVLGTAHYISPEQAQGKELDGTSDMYSLGCVLYEAATGQLPFDGPDAVSVAMRQVNEAPVPPSQINPEIHPDLEAIILKAMEKNPVNRFRTAREMKHALDDFMMGRPVNLGENVNSAATQVMNGVVPPISNDVPGGTAVMPAVSSMNGNSGPMKTVDYRAGGKEFDMGKKKSSKRTVGIVIGALVAILAIAGIALAVSGAFGGQTRVPDVTGQTEEAARQAIEAAGYVVGEVTEENSTDTVSGRVIRTDPAADSELAKGETVNIVVSIGAKKGTVPDLNGKTAEEAQQMIEDAGFVAKFGGNESSDAEENTVSRQDPASGTEADEGTTITYWISTGPELTNVPNVIGDDQATARATLESAGFTVSIQDGEYSDRYDEGVVMSQEPNGGQLEAGETVTIYISLGKDPATIPVNVPAVTGMSESEAISELNSAGFTNVGVSYESSNTVPEGDVIRQTQSGTATTDTYIEIVVSSGSGSSSTDDTQPTDPDDSTTQSDSQG